MDHLVRRGFEAAITATNGNGDGDMQQVDLPAWGILMLGSTVLLFGGVTFMIDYTFGRIVPTLLMIESAQENIDFEPLPTQDTDDSMPKDPESARARPQFITSSFRKTLRHLQSVGGFRARFRGFSIYIVQTIIVQWVAGMLSSPPFFGLFGRALTTIAAAVLCAQFSLCWTHIVISAPSPKMWFRRFPSIKMWTKIAGPTAVVALAEQVTVLVSVSLALASGFPSTPENLADMTPRKGNVIAAGSTASIILALGLTVVLVLPARVMLTRVQASLLPDTDETIIPFDRSFGGKVVPEIVGGSGVIGMLDAWASFDWNARVRLVKAYLKVFAMATAVGLLFGAVIVSELFIILGRDWSRLAPKDGNRGL